jgi:hypothetical protein
MYLLRNESRNGELMDKDKELTAAIDLVLQYLTDTNAHTIAALLEWNTSGEGDHERMERAYKAAQYVISGTR